MQADELPEVHLTLFLCLLIRIKMLIITYTIWLLDYLPT